MTVDVTELLPTDEDHQDSFKDSADPRNLVRIHGPDGALLASNRLATFVFCALHSLPSVPFCLFTRVSADLTSPDGGETNFPHAGGQTPLGGLGFRPTPTADTGLSVAPKVGAAVLFYSLRPDGAIDPFSTHAGCPPTEGSAEDKWVANLWLWNLKTAE